MARRLVAPGLVLAIAGLILLLVRDRTQPHPRAPRAEVEPAAKLLAPEAGGAASARVETAEPAPGRATVLGTVRYPDGGGAPGRRIQIGPTQWTDTDEAGAFRFADLEPHGYVLEVDGTLLVGGFHVAAGEVRELDVAISRGKVSGVVLDADTGEPVEGITVSLGPWRLGLTMWTGRAGRFGFSAIPPGTHSLSAWDSESRRRFSDPPSGYGTQTVECHVGASDVDVTLRLRRARPVQVRFENVPEAWRPKLPLMLSFRDPRGRLAEAWWGSGEAPLDLDGTQRLRHPPPAPPPGDYELVVAEGSRMVPWLSQPLSVPAGPVPEQTIRLPEGAPVTVEFPGAAGLRSHFLRIGPICIFEYAGPELRIPYVPEGRHGVWQLFPDCEVRVGEIAITAGRETRLVMAKGGTAALRGRPDPFGDDPAELRDSRGDVVARQRDTREEFAFPLLPAGSYVLEIGDRHFPVTLAEGEHRDMAILRGPGGATTRR